MSIIRGASSIRRRPSSTGITSSTSTLTADSGAFSLSGQAAVLLYNSSATTLVAASGAFSTIGTDAALLYSRILSTSSGSFILTGQDAALLTTNGLTAKVPQISLAGVLSSASLQLLAKTSSIEVAGVLAYGLNQSSTIAHAASIGILGGHVASVDAIQSIGDLAVIYSGGATNEDQAVSLGGMISLASNSGVLSQNFTQPVNITGANIIEVYGNPSGAGTLRVYTGSPPEYTWQSLGGTESPRVSASIAGNYTVGVYTEGQLYIYHDGINPSVDLADQITISSIRNNTYDNISFLDINARSVDYRCFYIKNTRSNTMYNVSISVITQPVNDSIELGLDLVGVGDGITTGVAATVATEDVAPAGVVFSTAAITVGDLLGREVKAFWVKRIVVGGLITARTDASRLAIQAFI